MFLHRMGEEIKSIPISIVTSAAMPILPVPTIAATCFDKRVPTVISVSAPKKGRVGISQRKSLIINLSFYWQHRYPGF